MKNFGAPHLLAIVFTFCFMVLTAMVGMHAPEDQEEGGGMAIASIPPAPLPADIPADIPAAPAVVEDLAQEVEEFSLTEINGEIEEGESFESSLLRAKVPREVRYQIIQAFTGCLDFKRLRPRDRFTVFLDEKGKLIRCTYQAGPLESYSVTRTGEGFEAGRDPVPIESRLIKLNGVVDSSLFQAFFEFEEEAKLVYAFADIFAAKIDFNTELRKNDRFSLLLEKYYRDDEFIGYGKILTARYHQAAQDKLLEAYFYSSEETPDGYFDGEGRNVGASFIRSPVPVARVSSKFSYNRRHPVSGVVKPHLGVDLAAPRGTPVLAVADGKVRFVGVNGGFGKQVILDHAGGYRTHYGHLSRYGKGLKKGKKVQQKEVIGYVGSTGISTGPHLDYRLEHLGTFKNPFAMEFKARTVLEGGEVARLQETIAQYMTLLETEQEDKILQVRKMTITADSSLSLL